MDHPIMADLKAARANAWQRLKTLAGLYVYYISNCRDPHPRAGIIDIATESEMRELRKLLNPKEDPVFVVPQPGTEVPSSILVTVEESRVTYQHSNLIPARNIDFPGDDPVNESISTTDDVAADLLRSLES